jgi:hypothetical protein
MHGDGILNQCSDATNVSEQLCPHLESAEGHVDRSCYGAVCNLTLHRWTSLLPLPYGGPGHASRVVEPPPPGTAALLSPSRRLALCSPAATAFSSDIIIIIVINSAVLIIPHDDRSMFVSSAHMQSITGSGLACRPPDLDCSCVMALTEFVSHCIANTIRGRLRRVICTDENTQYSTVCCHAHSEARLPGSTAMYATGDCMHSVGMHIHTIVTNHNYFCVHEFETF